MTTEPPSDKLFTAEETAILRRQYIEKNLIPVLEHRFQIFPQLQSAALLVAQYWDDEANDAVHFEWLFSVLETPDMVSAYSEEILDDIDLNNLPDLPIHWDITHQPDPPKFPYDDNGISIPLFAAYCREGCHQEMDRDESYSLFAIFRKTEEGIEAEYCGEMIRPWLEGIRPVSFQRFPEFERIALDQLFKETVD